MYFIDFISSGIISIRSSSINSHGATPDILYVCRIRPIYFQLRKQYYFNLSDLYTVFFCLLPLSDRYRINSFKRIHRVRDHIRDMVLLITNLTENIYILLHILLLQHI